jgi:O2-independent ubiquinone biosynthesis accessory factor UbiT
VSDGLPARLRAIRRLIDGVDDVMLLLLAGRRGLVSAAAGLKTAAGLPLRDPEREAQVRRRARRLSLPLAVPPSSADALSTLLIEDACRLQHPLRAAPGTDPTEETVMHESAQGDTTGEWADPVSASRWLRLLPPPRRWAPVLRVFPAAPAGLLSGALQHALAAPLASGLLDAIAGRRLGIAVIDLEAGWSMRVSDGRVEVEPGLATAEATVHGSATDLLLLASRLEDADTLFFQRRLKLTGDIELGLTARNLLDQLAWESIPLAARIALHRAARLARDARDAHRAGNRRANDAPAKPSAAC